MTVSVVEPLPSSLMFSSIGHLRGSEERIIAVFHRERYKFKREPYPHQVKAVKEALKQLGKTGGFGLLMEPRTGKTKVAIDTTCILHQKGRVNRVLIVCPVSVIGVWIEEIRLNCPFPRRVTVWDKNGRKRVMLPPAGQDVLDFVIVNYDAFSVPAAKTPSGKRSKVRGGKAELRIKLRRWGVQMMILDEMHRIKTPGAAKSKIIKSISKDVPYRLGLTGTVQTKKKRVIDVYSQWQFVNPTSPLVAPHDVTTFREEYGVWTTRSGYPQWLRSKNENKMRRLLHAEAFAVTRAEAYGSHSHRIPDQIIPVQLTGHTLEVYEEMAENMIARVKTGEITEAQIRLVLSLRLAQITGGLVKTTPTEMHQRARLVRVGRDKLDVFSDLVDDLFQADEKLVVAARFRGDIAGIKQTCQKLRVPAYELHGGIKSRTERDSQIAEFRQKPGPACFIMQPAAGSLGIDLSTASIFIWFSLTNSWVDFTQAEDRIALFPGPRIYMYLEAQGTIDRLMYESLQEDGEIGRLVMKAPERLWIPS